MQPLGQVGPRTCGAPGCWTLTKEAKPFCSRHVEHHPYVARLLCALEQRIADDKHASRHGPTAASLSAITATEIARYLSLCPSARSFRRICRDLSIEAVAARAYVQAMVSAGVLRQGIELGEHMVWHPTRAAPSPPSEEAAQRTLRKGPH